MGLHGKKDMSAPYHLAEAMLSGIKDSQMRTFPGGHVFFLLRQMLSDNYYSGRCWRLDLLVPLWRGSDGQLLRVDVLTDAPTHC